MTEINDRLPESRKRDSLFDIYHPAMKIYPQTISNRFVRYYHRLGFKQLPGTSLLHPSIPMTFVMSAGLAQVETAIDQLGRRSTDNDYVLAQTCFRHFDVNRIGQSDLHLSLFEMPGAFSFGANRRQMTVRRMWNFLVGELKLDPDRLWASYFAGETVSDHFFTEDGDTRRAWLELGLPEERVVPLGQEHNFWKQGGGIDGQETSRKCGPNTELFFDRGSHQCCGPACRPGCKCGRFVEFANSLFIFAQIDAETNALSLMAEPFTETVIGTERVAMLLSEEETVFDIATVKPLLRKLRSFYDTRQKENLVEIKAGERILVDHLRALVYLTADGAPSPGKGGRRRLMRILIRRVLAQMQILDIQSSACLPELIDLVIILDGGTHPKLVQGRDILLSYLDTESSAFNRTLTKGYRHLDHLLIKNQDRFLNGRQLVSLVKQFGIPLSLLKIVLARRGIEFREAEYLKAVEQWRATTYAH